MTFRNAIMKKDSHYSVHDLSFYSPSHVYGRKINHRIIVGFPMVANSYRVANVIISEESPSVIFRLIATDERCIYSELYLQVILLYNSDIHCTLTGTDRFDKSVGYLGDIVMSEAMLEEESPITFTFSTLTGVDLLLEESKDILSTYMREGSLKNKLCDVIYVSVVLNSKFV